MIGRDINNKMYRTINYKGETLRSLELRIKEIKDNEETIIVFTIETYE